MFPLLPIPPIPSPSPCTPIFILPLCLQKNPKIHNKQGKRPIRQKKKSYQNKMNQKPTKQKQINE